MIEAKYDSKDCGWKSKEVGHSYDTEIINYNDFLHNTKFKVGNGARV